MQRVCPLRVARGAEHPAENSPFGADLASGPEADARRLIQNADVANGGTGWKSRTVATAGNLREAGALADTEGPAHRVPLGRRCALGNLIHAKREDSRGADGFAPRRPEFDG